MRNLERLVLRGRHSAPGVLQQRAARRIPGQLQLMQRCFGEVPECPLTTEDYPDVKPPAETLRKAVQKGWLSAAAADRVAACEETMMSELLHASEDVFSSAQIMDAMPAHASETLCYFFCGNGGTPRWVVAPWGQLGGSAGKFWPQMPRSVAMWMSSAAASLKSVALIKAGASVL